jgi:hypothetical protein
MRRLATIVLMSVLVVPAAFAQFGDNPWVYERSIEFPADVRETVRPYLIAVAESGAIYLISSVATDTTARNALWRAEPGDDFFTLVHEYTGDGTVHATRGVTTIGNDVLVATHQQPGTDAAAIYYYTGGSRDQLQVFNTGGYGTHLFAISATDAGYVYATISAQASMRIYDFSDPASENFGKWVAMEPWWNSEAGGHDGCSVSALRDVAVIRGADYSLSTTPFYTSRNASPSPLPDGCTASVTGRVSRWVGGTNGEPAGYSSAPMSDAGGDLNLTSYVSAGIFADADARLWVTGPDSTRRWVKVFDVFDTFADELFELPSQTSQGAMGPDPDGAPFQGPNDVALNRAGSHAYVSDREARAVFVFYDATLVSVNEGSVLPEGFALQQNYPNPFNPSTVISYELAAAGPVRLAVFDVLGRQVALLEDGFRQAGSHEVTFDAAGLPGGAYIYRLEAAGGRQTRTLVLSK